MRVAVFISGNGTNLQALLNSVQERILPIDVCLVVSNNSKAKGLEYAQLFNIPYEIREFKKDEMTRDEYDDYLSQIVNNNNVDLVVLAGWMHVLSQSFLNNVNATVINLHPALPGAFPGTNSIERAFHAYQQGTIKETGIMVHYVVKEVDAGQVINTKHIPIYTFDTLETLTSRVKYYEKPVLIEAILNFFTTFVSKTNSDGLVPCYRGKVRDMYDLGYNLLAMVHSNRLSAFDRYICDIPCKGTVLTRLSEWWFRKTSHIIPNHLVHTTNHVMIVKKCKPFKIEVVVRGYITGNTKTSLWTHYNNGERVYCGLTFPDGLVKHQQLPNPIVTPTTKGETDELIDAETIVSLGLATQSEWDYISQKALELFEFGQYEALKRGFLLVDTKYEFGKDLTTGQILLMDEIHTCDSSRYWVADSYKVNVNDNNELFIDEPQKLDKDVIRDYLKANLDPYNYEGDFKVPETLIDHVADVYIRFLEQFDSRGVSLINEICVCDLSKYTDVNRIVSDYFEKVHNPLVVILSGSDKDATHVKKICDALKQKNIFSKCYVSSAHKNTRELLNILKWYEDQDRRVVYVTVAGRSNALSGVVASNSRYPVIACPPFKDQQDMMVNLHSTLQCPSNVPVMTVLDPGNVALCCKKILG